MVSKITTSFFIFMV